MNRKKLYNAIKKMGGKNLNENNLKHAVDPLVYGMGIKKVRKVRIGLCLGLLTGKHRL